MSQINILDEIILSNNVVESFYNQYNNNKDFKDWTSSNLPEINDCERQQQNNPWHKYNVLGHILHSVEEINKQTKHLNNNDRRILAYTMLFHDIGKPACHIVREKDGKLIDSFFNHNIKSERIARKILPNLNFNQQEIDIVAKLVFKHDIFMFIKEQKTSNPYWKVLSYDLIKQEIKDLSQVGDGKTLMRYLIMVGRADNLAQNEKMTAQSLAMLDKFDTMLDNLQ
ncbi:MAG: HD domain-containing protein [Clostridia bacterium]|nr:HD domain-containing protein [Clostridia bacterium]